jgi:dienelactone hydrolase
MTPTTPLRPIVDTVRPRRLRRLAVVALMWLAGALPAGAEGIRHHELTLPLTIEGHAVRLEALLLEPDDAARHPLALITHGSPREAADRPDMSPYGMWIEAQEFARRGWVAAIVMRRGYGASTGGWAEDFGPCKEADFTAAGRHGAADLSAAIVALTAQPEIEPGRAIAVGVSAGAFATVALSAAPPPGLVAALAFAPGRGSVSADQVCDEPKLIDAFARFGKTARLPLLWVAAPNDHFFGPRIVKAAVGAFTASGGQVTFVATAPFGNDGHFLFSGAGRAVWTPIVDRFLADHGLALRAQPTALVRPAVAPPAGLSARGRAAFGDYLDGAPHKAFAVAPDGSFGWVSGRGSADRARQGALDSCHNARCRLANLDDAPVK